MKRLVYRVIDANFNRAREGLRVCEEFVRFFADDKTLTRDFKNMRAKISEAYQGFLKENKAMISSRDSMGDVGRIGFPFERQRKKTLDIFWASIQRSKEALRVLEEFSKVADKRLSDEFRRLRYRAYELEKKAFKKLQ